MHAASDTALPKIDAKDWQATQDLTKRNAVRKSARGSLSKPYAGTAVPVDIAASESALLQSRLRSMVRPAMGSVAFLAAVECTWQLHEQ